MAGFGSPMTYLSDKNAQAVNARADMSGRAACRQHLRKEADHSA